MIKYIYFIFVFLSIILSLSVSSQTTKDNSYFEFYDTTKIKIIKNSQWGSKPFSGNYHVHKIDKITIHHSGEYFPEDKDVFQYLRNLQNWSRIEKKWIDIPYHFIIDLNGKIYEARPIIFPGETNTNYNPLGHALICLLGNYEIQTVNNKQLESLINLISILQEKYNVSQHNIRGHRDYTAETVCPGKNLYKFIEDGTIVKQLKKISKHFNSFITVKTGIEVLRERNFDILKGKRVGLVTNHTGVDRKLVSTIDILFNAPEVNLVALFGPEHGIRGNYAAGDYVDFYIDESTKLPVYSLYGKTNKPSPQMLQNVDVLVYDIQDIGSRSYTYISTMGLVMAAAAENNKEVVVLDRPNPLGGIRIEGNIVEENYFSFVSQFPIPYIYGLTVGELAILINEEGYLPNGVKCSLTVIPMEGWNRNMFFEDTGLPWVLTSRNIPHQHSPFYYPASGIVGELRNVISIGAGFTIPFQTFATEWFNSVQLANKMNSFGLPGVIFRPITFKSFKADGKEQMLNGVQIHILNYHLVELIPIQFYFLKAVHELYGKNLLLEDSTNIKMFDLVLGTNKIREMFNKNMNVDEVRSYLNKDIEKFRTISKKYHLYK